MRFKQCPQCSAPYGPMVYPTQRGYVVQDPYMCGGHAKDRTKLLDHGSIDRVLRNFLGLPPRRPEFGAVMSKKEEDFFNNGEA